MSKTTIGSIKPQQKRSAETRRKILGAVSSFLVEGTYDQTSIQDIVRRAGCSTGAFYGRFTDRNAALLALMEDRLRETEQRLEPCFSEPSLTGNTLADSVRSIVNILCDHTKDSLPLLRTSTIASMGQTDDDPFLKTVQAFNGTLLKSFTRLFRHHQQHIQQPPEQAAQMALAIVAGLSRDILRHGAAASGLKIDLKDVKQEIHRLTLAYLMFEAP